MDDLDEFSEGNEKVGREMYACGKGGSRRKRKEGKIE